MKMKYQRNRVHLVNSPLSFIVLINTFSNCCTPQIDYYICFLNTLTFEIVTISGTTTIMTMQYILFSGHANIVLATFENPASISPYRVNTSYRRPTGGESDHGYSTMTPHEDSEQASTTCLEPLIIGRDRYRPSSTNSSVISKPGALPPPPGINRWSRSPTPPQTQLLVMGGLSPTTRTATIPETTVLGPQTVLPSDIGTVVGDGHSPHSVIANVQVHMVDSH